MTRPTFDRPNRPMLVRPVAHHRGPLTHAAWAVATVAVLTLLTVAISHGYTNALDAITTPHLEGF
jgi:hypothetical protein